MDTDDLSRETYKGVLSEAEKLTHDLTLHYVVLASDCEDENEYLGKADSLTREIMECTDYELEDVFWGNPPDRKKLNSTLIKILSNIERVRSIPVKKRKYDF
jgi:hypothetical protein